MLQKEFAQKVVTEALGAFNGGGMKPFVEEGGIVRRDMDTRRKQVVRATGRERFRQQRPPGQESREQGPREQELPAAGIPRVRKRELPSTKTPQSKEERIRDHREQEGSATETPGSFPRRRSQGERSHSMRSPLKPHSGLGPRQKEPEQQADKEEPGTLYRWDETARRDREARETRRGLTEGASSRDLPGQESGEQAGVKASSGRSHLWRGKRSFQH